MNSFRMLMTLVLICLGGFTLGFLAYGFTCFQQGLYPQGWAMSSVAGILFIELLLIIRETLKP